MSVDELRALEQAATPAEEAPKYLSATDSADELWARRLMAKVEVDPDLGCWLWTTASVSHNGYAQFHYRGKTVRAHRLAYRFFAGPIPEGMVLDHLCSNRRCVNPAHLEPVTQVENMRRARRDRCGRGHEFTPENTIERGPGQGRCCRTCQRYHERAYKRRCRAVVALAASVPSGPAAAGPTTSKETR